MAESPFDKDNKDVIVRTCRVVIDVRIRISEITPENVAEDFTPDETDEGLPWEWAERQNRLMLTLLQNEKLLDQFLAYVAGGDLEFLVESKRPSSLSEEAVDDIFEKVYRGMEQEDRLFYEEARKDGILYDNIQLVHRAFVTDWEETEVIDVCVLQPDDGSTSRM